MCKRFFIVLLVISFLMSSCRDEEAIIPIMPVQETPLNANPGFDGSIWVIFKVQTLNLITQPELVNDTLKFISSTELTYNGIPCEYAFYPNGDLWYFELKQTPRFIGSINTFINRESINYGNINQQEFVNVYIRNQKWLIWMKKNN